MSRIWSLADPRQPSTMDGADLQPSIHVGVVSSTALVGPDALYAGSVHGYAPSRRIEAGVDSYAPGGSTPTHSHAKWEKVFVVLEGTARITVGDETRVVGPGSAAFVPVDVEHQFANTGEGVLRMFSVLAHLDQSGAAPSSGPVPERA